MSIQTFICTRCSGLVREVGHRVKSISASKFSGPEIVTLQHGGNAVAQSIWLSTYNMSTAEPETDADVRLFMRQKYYEQKWLNREKAISHTEYIKQMITDMFKEDGTRKSLSIETTSRRYSRDFRKNADVSVKRSSMDMSAHRQSVDEIPRRQSMDRPPIAPTQSWLDDNVPIGLISAVQKQPAVRTSPDLLSHTVDKLMLSNDIVLSPTMMRTDNNSSHGSFSGASSRRESKSSDIFMDLAALQPSPTQAVRSIYSGSILQPHSPVSPTIRSPQSISSLQPIKANIPSPQTKTSYTISDFDPYAALRNLSAESPSSNMTQPFKWEGTTTQQKTNPLIYNQNQGVNTSQDRTVNLFSDLDPLYKR